MAATATREHGLLVAAGLAEVDVQGWAAAAPRGAGGDGATPLPFHAAAERTSDYLRRGEALLARLPARPRRTEREAAAADAIKAAQQTVRAAFLRTHVRAAYDALTDGRRRPVRAEELVYAAAERFPGLTPSRAAVEAERQVAQKDKDGAEIAQGLFLSFALAEPDRGRHLVQTMLRPMQGSLDQLDAFRRRGVADFGTVEVRREGVAGVVYLRNTRYLNAEDDSTTGGMEMAADLVLLDPGIEVCVLRGAPVDHPKYGGRRVFSAGINLTRLYHGQISYLFYITRDLGYVHKIYRGLVVDEPAAADLEATLEKPWIAAVEAFAIGGGCQLLLVMDHVLAERGSYFNLPARKEGIIPGAANLRLGRFVGDRLMRQGILFDRAFPAASSEGQLLCDTLVPEGQMDQALAAAIAGFTGSGVVSAAGNRKAMRVGQEPLDVFRQYMAVYAREQAFCHFSPQLIRNLEQHWNARQRRL